MRVATTRKRKPISENTRAEDERLREELRHADIDKLKELMRPLIERPDKPQGAPPKEKKSSQT
jgi:hypothetical protein